MLTNESTIVPPTSIAQSSSLTTFTLSSTEISGTTSSIHTSVSRSSVVIVTSNSTSHSLGTSRSNSRPTSTVVLSITSVPTSTSRPVSTHHTVSSTLRPSSSSVVKPNNLPLDPPMASHSESSTSHSTSRSTSRLTTHSPSPSPTSTRNDAVSSTKPPPPPATTKSPSPNSTPGLGTTTQIVTTTPPPSGTITMLTTPSTTLSDPVALTLNINGSDVLSTPPLVTMISTSTDSNGGGFATVTQVVANPAPIEQTTDARTGILNNSGALAGIFIVIGVLVASMIIGIIWLIRRARRRARRARWLASIQRPGPASSDHNPFQDPTGSPSMRAVNTGDNHDWFAAGQARDMHTNERLNYDPPSSAGHGNTTSLFPDTYPILHNQQNQNYPRPGDQYALRSMNLKPNYLVPEPAPVPPRAQFSRSIAPSTPSEYPASLPDEDDDQGHHGTQLTTANRFSNEPVTNAPPRPPRSLLRENSKIMQYKPPTPPDSIMNSSAPNSPLETRPEDIFTRRTLLGVRSRAQV